MGLRAEGWSCGRRRVDRKWTVLLCVLVAGLFLSQIRDAKADLVLAPVADTYVRADQPNANFGSATRLNVDSTPKKDSLLRFRVSGVGSDSVGRALIRLYAKDASPAGGTLFPVANNSWSETTVTWATAPTPSTTTPAASLGPVSSGMWVSLDVSALVRGDGTYSFRMPSSSSDSAGYVSSEGTAAQRPQLVLTLRDLSAPTVSITSPPADAQVAGTVDVTASASDDVGVVRVEFRLDGVTRLSDTAAPWEWRWDTTTAAAGAHRLTGAAYDAAGRITVSASVWVTVANGSDSAAPTVPQGLTGVAPNGRRINVAWEASTDDVAVAGYQVWRDGVMVANQVPGTGYADWNALPGGTHAYQVAAYDAGGNLSAMSDSLEVRTGEAFPGFTFAVGGDHGANPQTQASLSVLDGSASEFYVALGDLDYDQTSSDAGWCDYVKARLPKKGAEFPFELVSGNHEQDGGPDGYILNHTACLPNRLTVTPGPVRGYGVEYYTDYPVAQPIARVILVAPGIAVDGHVYSYMNGTQHQQWLSSAIDDARARGIPWVIVGMHKVCISAGVKSCEIHRDLMNLLVAKRVDLVLQGHEHAFMRSKQLALNPATCPAIVPGSFDPDCIAADGSTGMYTKGSGSVVVINGSFGSGLRAINRGDAEAPYFAHFDDQSHGYTEIWADADRLDVRFRSNTGSFPDSFLIGAGAPGIGLSGGPDDGGVIPFATPAYGGNAVDPGGTVQAVEVSVDRGPYETAAVACTGCGTASAAWSWNPVAPLPDGPHSIAFRARDDAGNPSATVPRSLVVDTGPPTLSVTSGPAEGSVERDPMASFAGRADDAVTSVATVVASIDGAEFSSEGVTCEGCGSASVTWSWTPAAPLPEGPHTLAFRVRDAAGRLSDETTRAFVVDSVGPVFVHASATGGVPVVAASFSEPLACSSTERSDFSVTQDGIDVAVEELTCEGSDVRLGLSSPPPGGALVAVTLQGVVSDPAGNEATGGPQAVVADNVVPTLDVMEGPPTGATVSDATPDYSGSASDPDGVVARVEVAVDGQAFSDGDVVCLGCDSASATWSWSPGALLADGGHTISFRSVDGAGEVSGEVSRVVVVDTAAPSLEVTGGPEDGATIGDGSPVFSGWAADGTAGVAGVEVSVDEGAWTNLGVGCGGCGTGFATWEWSPVDALGDGSHSVAVRAVDAVGNVSAAVVRVVVVDTAAPSLEVTGGPEDGATIGDGSPVFSGSAADAAAGVAWVEVSVDGAGFSEGGVVCTDCQTASATWSWVPSTPLADGVHTLSFHSVDGAGNVSETVVRILTVEPIVG